MTRFLWLLALAVPLAGTPLLAQTDQKPLMVWTVEWEDDGGLQVLDGLAEEFGKAKGIRIQVENRSVETLRDDFSSASMAGSPPDVIWTVSDHVGPWAQAGYLLPLDDLLDLSVFHPQTLLAGKGEPQVALPVTIGTHLMLYYHKSLVPHPPKTTQELIQTAKKLTKGNSYGLVFNQEEPFWLIPWLHGFGGAVMDAQGRPTLDTPAMVKALEFISDLKYKHQILPPESDYAAAQSLFLKKELRSGKYQAAMLINGDWALESLAEKIPDLGLAPLPLVSATGLPAQAYTSGKYCLVPSALKTDKSRLAQVAEFLKFITSPEAQLKMAQELRRLPVRKDLPAAVPWSSDPRMNDFLQMSQRAALQSIPMPTVPQMRAIWDNTRPRLQGVLSKKEPPKTAAEKMQLETLKALDREKNSQ